MSDAVKNKIVIYLLYGLSFVVFCYACISLYKIITTSAPDFGVYYGATKQLVSGINPYLGSTLYTGFGYPPFTAIVFVPFLLLPEHTAQGLFIILSAISIPISVWLLLLTFGGEHVQNHELALWSSVSFLLFPTRFTLGMGQSNLIVLALICGSLFAWKRRNKIISSVLFGLAMCIKPHLVLLLPFILFSKEPLFVLVSVGIVAGMGIGSIILFGWERYIQYYYDMVLTLLPFSGRGIYYNQGFSGFFARILPQNPASIATIVSSGLLYVVGLLGIVKNRIKFPVVVAFGLCVMVLVEPLSWQHHGVYLLPAFIVIWTIIYNSKASAIFLICSLLLVGYNIRQPEIFQTGVFGSLILSHGFVGTILITGLMLSSFGKHHI